jgi:hypothetical protein
MTDKAGRPLSVHEIVSQYLTANGYDGLAGDCCGCGLDDLMACGDECSDCGPAYRWEREHCERWRSEDCDFLAECGEDGGCWRTEKQSHAEDCDCETCREASIVDYPEG